jgi:hypothetical protein
VATKILKKWICNLESHSKLFSLIGNWLIWKVGDGADILIGKYPWIKCKGKHILPYPLI